MNLVEFTESLVKNLVKEPEMVKVQEFESDENGTILEIIVHESDMGCIIGKGGKMASALRTIILSYAYAHKLNNIKINIDSF